MSLPARSSLIAWARLRYEYVRPGGEETRRICLTMSEPRVERAATEARMHIIAPSKLFSSSVCRSLTPGDLVYRRWNAVAARVPSGDPAAVPRAPSSEAVGMKDGIVAGQPPATNSLLPLKRPVRSRADA